MVGYDVLDDFTHAAVWKKGRTVQLPQANAYGWGQAISDDGTVVGGNPQPGGTGIVNQAALWRNGRYLDLQPTGTCYGQASDIDDADTSVGYISPPGDCNGERPQAAVWTRSGRFTNLTPLTGQAFAYANAINRSGTIVGEAFGYSLVPSAWIYSHGSLTYLQDLMPADTPWTLQNAEGINNRGQIIGWAVSENTGANVLLTPTSG